MTEQRESGIPESTLIASNRCAFHATSHLHALVHSRSSLPHIIRPMCFHQDLETGVSLPIVTIKELGSAYALKAGEMPLSFLGDTMTIRLDLLPFALLPPEGSIQFIGLHIALKGPRDELSCIFHLGRFTTTEETLDQEVKLRWWHLKGVRPIITTFTDMLNEIHSKSQSLEFLSKFLERQLQNIFLYHFPNETRILHLKT